MMKLISGTKIVPIQYELWAWFIYETEAGWDYDLDKVRVLAALVGTEELVQPAEIEIVQSGISGRPERKRIMGCHERYADELVREEEKWDYCPVSFLILPENPGKRESLIVPSKHLVFSEKALKEQCPETYKVTSV